MREAGCVAVVLNMFLSNIVFCFFLWQDPTLLEGRVTLHHVKAGSVVARQGDQVRTTTTSFLFYVSCKVFDIFLTFLIVFPSSVSVETLQGRLYMTRFTGRAMCLLCVKLAL